MRKAQLTMLPIAALFAAALWRDPNTRGTGRRLRGLNPRLRDQQTPAERARRIAAATAKRARRGARNLSCMRDA